jgi:addiction module HigA family antidote
MAADTIMGPVHPGEILLEEFLKPLAVSQYQLAREISVPARRINEIVHGQRRISADTALRLARFFGTSERFWINLQSRYDLEVEKDRRRTRWHPPAHGRQLTGSPEASVPGVL